MLVAYFSADTFGHHLPSAPTPLAAMDLGFVAGKSRPALQAEHFGLCMAGGGVWTVLVVGVCMGWLRGLHFDVDVFFQKQSRSKSSKVLGKALCSVSMYKPPLPNYTPYCNSYMELARSSLPSGANIKRSAPYKLSTFSSARRERPTAMAWLLGSGYGSTWGVSTK